MQHRLATAVTRFWRRLRDWPLVGQLAFALLLVFIVVTLAAVISNALRGDRADRTGASGRAASSSTSTSVRPTLSSSTTTSTSTLPAAPTTRAPKKSPRLVTLTIASQTHEDSYDRDNDFGGWIDQNGCQDTRAVLLVRTSKAPVTFTSSNRCTVESGRWIDTWSGVVATVAHAFQIDHTVPLYNAWVSGAWSWSQEQRVAYANDLADKDHLVAIDASENESKGADGPDQWRPPNRKAWCRYALTWDRVKAKWHLTATPTEWTALVEMAATC